MFPLHVVVLSRVNTIHEALNTRKDVSIFWDSDTSRTCRTHTFPQWSTRGGGCPGPALGRFVPRDLRTYQRAIVKKMQWIVRNSKNPLAVRKFQIWCLSETLSFYLCLTYVFQIIAIFRSSIPLSPWIQFNQLWPCCAHLCKNITQVAKYQLRIT